MYVIIENIEEYLDTRIVKKESGELFFDSIEEGLEYLLGSCIYYLSGFCHDEKYEKINDLLKMYKIIKITEEINDINIDNYPIVKNKIINDIKNKIDKDLEEYKEQIKEKISEYQKELERIEGNERA